MHSFLFTRFYIYRHYYTYLPAINPIILLLPDMGDWAEAKLPGLCDQRYIHAASVPRCVSKAE